MLRKKESDEMSRKIYNIKVLLEDMGAGNMPPKLSLIQIIGDIADEIYEMSKNLLENQGKH